MATGFNLALLITLLGVPKKIMNKASLSLAIVNITFLMYPVLSTFNPNNIIIFNRRVDRFIHEDKLSFVSSERISGVRDLQEIFSQESCIFSLTSESAMPYLLNKPSCGPIYISYFASAEPMRNNLLTDLKVYKPKYILYSSKSWTQSMDRINNEQRFPNVMNYVEANYSYFETVSDYWVVYKINQ